jgi:putative ATPase
LSAVESEKKICLKIIKEAKEDFKYNNKKTILFIDEIHRWNKANRTRCCLMWKKVMLF